MVTEHLKYASCAFKIGFKHGFNKKENKRLTTKFYNTSESQKTERKHKTSYTTYEFGYI